MKAFPIIVSSPSGGGKTTVVSALLKRDKTLCRVITATTRSPRKGEKDGRDYLFCSEAEFKESIEDGCMLEWAKVHAHYYGVPRSSVEGVLKAGACPVLVIDVQGAKTISKAYPEAVRIFIVPPSLSELRRRIQARNDATQDVELRLKTAKRELKEITHYDYVVLNDDLKKAIKQTAAIIQAEQSRVERQLADLKKSKVI